MAFVEMPFEIMAGFAMTFVLYAFAPITFVLKTFL